MAKNIKLTEGSIPKALVELALPIIGTSFVQMAYSMTDMIWLGRVGSRAVAAVGTAGFFTWLAAALILLPKIAAGIGVAQSVGNNNMEEAQKYIKHSIQLDVALGLIYGLCIIILRKPLVNFFKLGDTYTIEKAINYLVIVSAGMVFFFLPPVYTAIFNGYGDSHTPFKINLIGLLVNIVLDPVLIFGIGPFPVMGVEGAAVATVFAQFLVTAAFIYSTKFKGGLFSGIKYFSTPDWSFNLKIIKLGMPAGLQSAFFTFVSMIIARLIAAWGPIPIAVQKVGSQIEAISWMTSEGFEVALGAFVGQNYGARKWNRIHKGYYTAIKIAGAVGLFTTCLLIFGARPIFSLFIPEEETIKYGITYLKILGLSQFFMCIEITTAGAFNGIGKTFPPSIEGIIFNGIRIPLAMALSSIPSLGLNGIWWSLSITSMLKGIVLFSWFALLLKKCPSKDEADFAVQL